MFSGLIRYILCSATFRQGGVGEGGKGGRGMEGVVRGDGGWGWDKGRGVVILFQPNQNIALIFSIAMKYSWCLLAD